MYFKNFEDMSYILQNFKTFHEQTVKILKFKLKKFPFQRSLTVERGHLQPLIQLRFLDPISPAKKAEL